MRLGFDKFICKNCGYGSRNRFDNDICPICCLTDWKCAYCSYILTSAFPKEICPECGSQESIKLTATCCVEVSDDGTEMGEDFDWDDERLSDGYARCMTCGHHGTNADFNALYYCDNCEWCAESEEVMREQCEFDDPSLIPDLAKRLDVGGEVPAAECPRCGHLVYRLIRSKPE